MKVVGIPMLPAIPMLPIQGRLLMSFPDALEAAAHGVPREKIGIVINEDGDWVAMDEMKWNHAVHEL